MLLVKLPLIEGGTVIAPVFNPIQIVSVINTYEGCYINSLYDLINNDKGVQGLLSFLSYDDVKALLLPTGYFYELTLLNSSLPALFNGIQTVGIAPYLNTHCQIMQNSLNNASYVQESFATVKTILEGL